MDFILIIAAGIVLTIIFFALIMWCLECDIYDEDDY